MREEYHADDAARYYFTAAPLFHCFPRQRFAMPAVYRAFHIAAAGRSFYLAPRQGQWPQAAFSPSSAISLML